MDNPEVLPTKPFKLKVISYVTLFLVFPFYVFWTFLGTQWFVASNETSDCFSDIEQYSFMIFWVIINLILIISYLILTFSLYLALDNIHTIRKNTILLLRRLDVHEVDNELFDSALANVEQENARRQELL